MRYECISGDYTVGITKKCPICGKSFNMMTREWAYKRSNKQGEKFFCSWKCFRLYEEAPDGRRRRRKNAQP